MSRAIHTVRGFRRAFPVGSVFYHLISWHGRPERIAGPVLIENYNLWPTKPLFKGERIKYNWVINQSPWDSIPYHFVGDLVNEVHGVFRTKEQGERYLKRLLKKEG